MKLVIVGASGNVGTAILRALGKSAEPWEVVAIARRVPRRTPPAPYDVARWMAVDVGGPDDDEIVAALARAMSGADAVIQLAWIIQPNHERESLRRTNVRGTSRVLAAARLAGVPHVVVASSVGAYAPCDDELDHDESWPIGGVPSSEYSVDKAVVEGMLDDHERDHPSVLITRLRPALIFQRAAGAQIMRNFMLPAVPGWAFRGHLPVLPFPSRMRLQAVHADDVARAYLAAVREWPGGAFNIAADDVLEQPQLASLLAGRRSIPVPQQLVRGSVWAAWNARVVPASPGWLDMAEASPRLSTERARSVLGWEPRLSAYDTVAEVFEGMAEGAGTASPPLRPRGSLMGSARTRTPVSQPA